MNFLSLMHISFYTANFDGMRDFYVNKLGLKEKIRVRYKEYKGSTRRPQFAKIAEETPDRIFYSYIELAPGQFMELFSEEAADTAAVFQKRIPGYSHFALIVADIQKAKAEFLADGIKPDTEPSKGPSGTWQMWIHDPDGNRFEVMQYTEESWQITDHFT